MLIFRQLFDPTSSTYSYLLGDGVSRQAVLIDPVMEQEGRDRALLGELGLNLQYTLETHVHADHVTAASLLKQHLGSRIALSRHANAEGADRLLGDGDRIEFGKRYVTVRETPGHTNSCVTYIMDNESMAFTGDCLLIRGCGRTDFQQGDARQLYRSVRDKIFSLPQDCLIYPGHDYRGVSVSSVAEERAFNPRLGGDLSESDFAGYMDNLGLPHPKKMDIAVPANLRCGQPQGGAPAQDPDWAPLSFTFAGVWEIAPNWVAEHREQVLLLDVREEEEFTGPLGHIAGARLVPLGALAQHADDLSRDKPIVTICRAGGRSAQATHILRKAGFERVANLAGGMLRWRTEGYGVEGGAE